MYCSESSSENRHLAVVHLGADTSYREVWELQKELQAKLIAGEGTPHLLLCEHRPVITLGKSGAQSNVLLPEQVLQEKGVELFTIERGGDATYHGPGQLVGYPILDLTKLKRDVGWYVRRLEEVILRTLSEYNIVGIRIPGRAGVWLDSTSEDKQSTDRKIAFIGVKLSRWCTLHGFSLNVHPCRDGFQLINPCGFTNIRVTSMVEETSARIEVSEVTERLIRHFAEIFTFDIQR